MSALRSILRHIDACTPTAPSLPFVTGQQAAELLPMLQQLDGAGTDGPVSVVRS